MPPGDDPRTPASGPRSVFRLFRRCNQQKNAKLFSKFHVLPGFSIFSSTFLTFGWVFAHPLWIRHLTVKSRPEMLSFSHKSRPEMRITGYACYWNFTVTSPPRPRVRRTPHSFLLCMPPSSPPLKASGSTGRYSRVIAVRGSACQENT